MMIELMVIIFHILVLFFYIILFSVAKAKMRQALHLYFHSLYMRKLLLNLTLFIQVFESVIRFVMRGKIMTGKILELRLKLL